MPCGRPQPYWLCVAGDRAQLAARLEEVLGLASVRDDVAEVVHQTLELTHV
jgi:hypothetical protein